MLSAQPPILELIAKIPSPADELDQLRWVRDRLNATYQDFENNSDFLAALFYKGMISDVVAQIERSDIGTSGSALMARRTMVNALIASLQAASGFAENTRTLANWFDHIHRFLGQYRQFLPFVSGANYISLADATFIAIEHQYNEFRHNQKSMIEIDDVPLDVYLRFDATDTADATTRSANEWYVNEVSRWKADHQRDVTLCFIDTSPSIHPYAPSGGLSLMPVLFGKTANPPLVVRTGLDNSTLQLDIKAQTDVREVILVDDAVRSGDTIAEATRFLRQAHGIDVSAAMVLANFEEGAEDTLRALDVPLHAKFNWSEIESNFIEAFRTSPYSFYIHALPSIDKSVLTRKNRDTMSAVEQFESGGVVAHEQSVEDPAQAPISPLATYHHSLTPNLERLQARKRQNEEIERAMGARSLATYHHSLTPNLERLQARQRQNEEIERAMLSRNAVDV